MFTDPSLTAAAYAIAKRSNQVRVQAASMPYGRKGPRVVSISPGIISTRMGQSELQGASGERIRSLVTASGSAAMRPAPGVTWLVDCRGGRVFTSLKQSGRR